MPRLRLDEVLKKKKITRFRFAGMCGRSYPNTKIWYQADYDPRLSTLIMWATVLKLRVRDFIKED